MEIITRRSILRAAPAAVIGAAFPGIAIAAFGEGDPKVSTLRHSLNVVSARLVRLNDTWQSVYDRWQDAEPQTPRELWVPGKWAFTRYGNLFERGWKGGPWKTLTAACAEIILEGSREQKNLGWVPGDPEDEHWDTAWTEIWDWTRERQPAAVAFAALKKEWQAADNGLSEINAELDAVGLALEQIEAEIMALPVELPGAFILKVQVLAAFQRRKLDLDEVAEDPLSHDAMFARVFDDADLLAGGAA
jgi:hypothetical protein